MVRSIRIYILSLLILVLTSCGFQPIYKTADRNIDSVNYSVKFKNEPGYEVKNKIKEVFNYSNSENFYTVNLTVHESNTPLIVNTNGTVSKYRLEIIIHFDLIKNSTNKSIYEDVVRGFAEYFVQTSEIQTNEKRKQAIEVATEDAIQMMSVKIQSNIAQSE
tara:strand:- start:596 stop:1081 length:486 start_codon:yes stop_codon:yes gene_type:complete